MTTTQNQIGKTILQQIGNPALFMLGAKHLAVKENGCSFRIQGSTKANHIEVTLDPSDTYTMTFRKIRGNAVAVVKEYEMVYADMLNDLIETVTGLRTSL